jgi:hypothetical protein
MNLRNLFITITVFVVMTSSAFSKRPTWILKPYSKCKKSYLCVVGEGTGFLQAESNARSNMAKIFKTKISSKFKSSLSEDDGDVSATLSDVVEEEVSGMISGVEIAERYEGEDQVFVLAKLHKMKTANYLKGKIDEMDSKMEVLYKSKDRASAAKLMESYRIREGLNDQYQFLTRKPLKKRITYEQIVKKQEEATKGVLLKVMIRQGTPDEMKGIIIATLTRIGYKVAKDNDQRFTHIITGNLVRKKMYMKVEGFLKHQYTLTLTAESKSGEKQGSLTHEEVTTGRNADQTMDLALPAIKNYIFDNISKLSIK